MMRFLFIFFLSYLLMAQPVMARDIDTNRLDARINQMMQERGMVGLAIVVIQDGEVVHRRGYGFTRDGSSERVTEDTVFRWASLSKGVGAAMAVKLDETGDINLAAPISSYKTTLRLPKRGENKADLFDLLSHQLGIVRNAYDHRLEAGTMPAVIRGQLAGLPIECPVGTCHGYQNVAFDTISEIVQGATGEPYQLAAKRLIFEPLDMNTATMTKNGLMSSTRWARPHTRNGRISKRTMRESYYRVPAAGGVNGSITDLGKWMMANMGMNSEVLSAQALTTLQTPRVITPRQRRRIRQFFPRMTRADYGLGWRIYDYAGNKTVGHRGAVNGFRSMIMFDPSRRSGVAVLWNSGSNQPVGIQLEVMDEVYDLPREDWMYLANGPDLRAIRRAHPETIMPEFIPVPNISPQKKDRRFPVDHGAPIYLVSNCFGFSSPHSGDQPFEGQNQQPLF
ncbi:serine hydrolase domain-containing protein [Robiginitomaculum antarcticum]|uniref:serine hydrolase domain-containing protein n=1 Tax=Robiginitomaculum antarcticum TaxID=437507 RepID=UPI00039E4B3D|nr:serine hydrolase domain-containing protein [Robiginitomaculum antarcticum]